MRLPWQTIRLCNVMNRFRYNDPYYRSLLTLDAVDLYLSQAAEEVLKRYGFKLADIREKMPVHQ